MPRGPAPQWRARKEPVLDAYVLASVHRAGGPGAHDKTTGRYATMTIAGLASREEAAEYKRALFRSAKYLHRLGMADVSMHCEPIKKDGDTYTLSFRAVDKTWARKLFLERYGNDRSKWPYDPHRRGSS